MLQIGQVFIYPVKSLAGIELPEALLTDRGFEHDRRWMLVDENNRFLTQRELPQMALLQPILLENRMIIQHKNSGDAIDVPFISSSNKFLEVVVWDDTCLVQAVSSRLDDWFCRQLGINCRLVYMPDDSIRKVDVNYASNDELTSLSDGFPLLLLGQASLDDLNSRLDEPLGMERFRPNIVFSGGEPYAEDRMKHFSISGIEFYGVKPCARCPIPTINQQTLEQGKEPLRTLATYRRRNHKVYFGQNLLYNGMGIIRAGDPVEIIEMAPVESLVFDQSSASGTISS